MSDAQKTVIRNRKALHDYAVTDRIEAGIVLRGSEVKSLREGQGQLRDAYARIEAGEVVLFGMHIPPYSAASTHETLEPLRPRKLLLHREEISRLERQTRDKGMTLVPLRVYFTHGLAKVEIGLARGKRAYDHRRDIAAREADREIERERRRLERG